MAKKKSIDWESVEKLYKAGQISIREIARRCGCNDKTVREKARKEGWTRDLSEKIRREVRSRLLRAPHRTAEEEKATEEQVVDAGVAQGVEIELLQRKDIQKLNDLVIKLMAELDDDPMKVYITQFKGAIISSDLNLTVAEKSSALSNLANVLHKKIELERQAYNLDSEETITSDLGKVLKSVTGGGLKL